MFSRDMKVKQEFNACVSCCLDYMFGGSFVTCVSHATDGPVICLKL